MILSPELPNGLPSRAASAPKPTERPALGTPGDSREFRAFRDSMSCHEEIIGGERGINSPLQATVSQPFFQIREYSYHHNQGTNVALNGRHESLSSHRYLYDTTTLFLQSRAAIVAVMDFLRASSGS
jgi:hypothetical protein